MSSTQRSITSSMYWRVASSDGSKKLPANVVGNIRGVVKLIAVFEDRLLFPQMAQYPKLLKPGHVTDFPKRRIDDG